MLLQKFYLLNLKKVFILLTNLLNLVILYLMHRFKPITVRGKMKIGFDNEKYLELQSKEILKRINDNNGKLYLEFGGKLFDDLHASRVLPGFDPNIKIKLLKKLKEQTEIILVISAVDIERNKIRADFDITYDLEVLRLIDNLRTEGLEVSAVVITLFNGQQSAKLFGNKLERRNERVYYHHLTKGYPHDVNTIVSEDGYGSNPFIKTEKPLVVISAPGPNSGKLATCLSQLYHEFKRGVKAGYAKYETFPVWNLPLKHPVNVAYETATADVKDVNMIDPFHFNAYNQIAVNYNRDIDVFPVLKNILQKITQKECIYKSPTDMGVNMVAQAIIDDKIVSEASRQEIIRRYYRAKCDYKNGLVENFVPEKISVCMYDLNISEKERLVTTAALQKQKETTSPSFALQLDDGKIICGRTKSLVSAPTACILNCLKELSQIGDDIDLIPSNILQPILSLNSKILDKKFGVLGLKDVLIALSVSATINPVAKRALENINKLKGTQAHSTYILPASEAEVLKKIGINVTCEPIFISKNLYNN